jgi:hypothetical protein
MNQENVRWRNEMEVVSWDDYELLRVIGAMDQEMCGGRFEELVEDW